LVQLGDLPGALSWVRAHGLGAADKLTYLREYEHVTLARVLLGEHLVDGADAVLQEASGLLDRLLTAAEGGGRPAPPSSAGAAIACPTGRWVVRPGADRAAAALALAEPEATSACSSAREPMSACCEV